MTLTKVIKKSANQNKPLEPCHSIQQFLATSEKLVQEYDDAGSNFIITVFEWQHFVPTLHGCGSDATKYILNKIELLLQNNISFLCYFYLSMNKIVTIARCDDIKLYHNKIENFFQDSIKFGASLKPIPLYIGFKAGSSSVTLEQNITTTLNNASIALFEVKEFNCHRHNNQEQPFETVDSHYHQMQLAGYFLEAIESNKLRLAFQPVINARTGKVEGYEALLRILTSDGQIISAGPFIPTAESFGFINLIDHFVLESVAEELKTDSDVKIAMNISNLTVKDDSWYLKAKKILPPKLANRLTIEITETGNEHNLVKVAQFVDKVKSLGCNVAIDDFGAGYTSFKQLKLISADVLKIDGIFVRDIMDNHESRLFVNILLEFARAYNLKTVAEYVETGEIAKILMDLGVDYLQGFYFDKALNYRPWIKDEPLIALAQ